MFNTDGTTAKEETNKNGLNKPMDNKNKVNKLPIHTAKNNEKIRGAEAHIKLEDINETINNSHNFNPSTQKGNNGFKENMEKTDSRDDSEYLSLVFKSQEETKKVLNTFIKDFLKKSGMEETATTFGIENANNFLEPFDRASNTEEEKILEAFKIKRSFLNEWWQIFWDVFNAKTHKNGSTIAQEYYSFNVSRQHLDFLCRQGSMKAAFEQQMSERRGDYQMEAMQQYSSMSALNVPNSFSDKGAPMMHMGQGLTQNPYQAFFHSQQQQQSPNTSNMQQKQQMLNLQQLQQQSPNATTMQKQQMLHIQQQQLQQIQQLQQQMQQQQKSVYQKANISNNSNNNTPTSATTTKTTTTTKKNKNITSNASEKQQQQKKNNNKQGTGLTKQQMVQQRLAKVSPMVVTPEFPAAVKNKQVNTAINQMNINSNITNNLNNNINIQSFSNVSNMSSFNDQLASMAKELENSSDSMMITNMDNFPNPNINKDSKNT
ncbi:hypothetical protein HANVADRAFT_4807 [Hanseniaspora valbyensis NRRL Y-1626]|uniref:Uncharacterized protein n=1 Tax=Hanseniaspora valbyensis NRRL Y-1626 TaxID=766949 RepID=A0A1B7TJX8_9ASCO|nr:hypothetical protein HANVADRAFT_4807 [Hanseniaspora valbyensis NRRL Y-1626]